MSFISAVRRRPWLTLCALGLVLGASYAYAEQSPGSDGASPMARGGAIRNGQAVLSSDVAPMMGGAVRNGQIGIKPVAVPQSSSDLP
jgi:hypothetical protein